MQIMSKESCLNITELDQIIKEAKNPIYKESNLLFLGRVKTDIIRVSKNKELILIHGNSKTGLVHINERHNSILNKPFWKQKKDEGETQYILDNPSRFSISTIPFYDYVNIAEKLFVPKYINKKNNINPKYSDLYEGDVDLGHIESSRYRLILYKGTKVIHNLYPVGNKFTPKKIINYRKGNASMMQDHYNCISIIEIPYLNHNNRTIYKAIFKFDRINNTEILFIQINSPSGKPIITKYIGERPLHVNIVSPMLMMNYDLEDLSYIEKIISLINTQNIFNYKYWA